MSDSILYGFDKSTYVRTVRMVFAEKGAQYDLVPVNVLEGEPGKPEHLKRHPFGKVPVLEHDGTKILETSAIVRYLNDVLPGPSLVPENPKDRVRMDMAMAIHDAYGYPALLGGVAAYHLFPDFVGGKNEEARKNGIGQSRLVLNELMTLRGSSKFIAGDRQTLADFYLAPVCFYVALTEDAQNVFSVKGFDEWWARVRELESYKDTEPNLDG